MNERKKVIDCINLASRCDRDPCPLHILFKLALMTLAEQADIHKCYQEAVQDPRKEVRNLKNIFLDAQTRYCTERPRNPLILREDFCGTAILCKEWVQGHVERSAIGVDLDRAVLAYGESQFPDECVSSRIELCHANVLTIDNENLEKADIVAALNYAVCYFHSRKLLLEYLRRAMQSTASGGVFICDLFGSSRPLSEPWIFHRKCSNFDYIFEQSPVDFATNVSTCTINFKFKDGSTLKHAFSYSFRLWSIPDILEAIEDAGFQKVDIWISINDTDGMRDFQRVENKRLPLKAEAWNAYIVGFVPEQK